MAEYIDREALFAEFDRLGLGEHSIVEKVFSIGVRTIIAGMPAADVAPVVRCKGCAHYYMGACMKIYSDGGVHLAAWQNRRPEDFCSYGERKAGADNG